MFWPIVKLVEREANLESEPPKQVVSYVRRKVSPGRFGADVC